MRNGEEDVTAELPNLVGDDAGYDPIEFGETDAGVPDIVCLRGAVSTPTDLGVRLRVTLLGVVEDGGIGDFPKVGVAEFAKIGLGRRFLLALSLGVPTPLYPVMEIVFVGLRLGELLRSTNSVPPGLG